MNSIPVFFSHKMIANIESMSPSAGKPVQVVASWQKLGISLEIIAPAPATLSELHAAHDPTFVDDMLACRIDNGFGNRSPEVAASLPYTSGAMLSAARHLLRTGGKVAAAPCSGFHHAEYAEAQGFCSLNGIMACAAALRQDNPNIKVGILDFDYHYGNGTDHIISKLDAREWVTHYTAGDKFTRPEQAAAFFRELPSIFYSMSDCDIILYQAGADAHVEDPYGGILTTAELKSRDGWVFDTFRTMGIPVVWNLAGGYQVEADGSIPKVLEIHDNTMLECARVHLKN